VLGFPDEVLIVDDERDIRETLDMVLRYAGYETALASGPRRLFPSSRRPRSPRCVSST